MIELENYKLQYNFELISECNQLFILIYLFHSFPNTENGRKRNCIPTCMIVYAHTNLKIFVTLYELLFILYYLFFSWLFSRPTLAFSCWGAEKQVLSITFKKHFEKSKYFQSAITQYNSIKRRSWPRSATSSRSFSYR